MNAFTIIVHLQEESNFCIAEDKNAISPDEILIYIVNKHSTTHQGFKHFLCNWNDWTENWRTIMNFRVYMWNAKYYGIRSYSLPCVWYRKYNESHMFWFAWRWCAHVMKISPWTLFEKRLEASCSLGDTIPAIMQPFFVYYSLDLKYQFRGINWVDLPSETMVNLTVERNIIQVGVLIFSASEATITYHANKIYENGVIIMCSCWILVTENLCLELGKSL